MKRFLIILVASATLFIPLIRAQDAAPEEKDHFKSAVSLMRSGQYGPARELLKKAMTDEPLNTEILAAAAYAAVKDGAEEDAIDLYRRLVRIHLALPEAAADQDQHAERARRYLREKSPASLRVLHYAREVKDNLAHAVTAEDFSMLAKAYAALVDTALGAPPPGVPGIVPAMPKALIEETLGYRLSDVLRKRDHQDAIQWDNGHHYKLFPRAESWEAARKRCEEMGGYLATITSEAENIFLVDLAAGTPAYFGATVKNPQNDWQWITGEPWTYERLNNAQPNDQEDGDGLRLRADGKWNAAETTTTGAFICEWQ